jgi:hypothetical protein
MKKLVISAVLIGWGTMLLASNPVTPSEEGRIVIQKTEKAPGITVSKEEQTKFDESIKKLEERLKEATPKEREEIAKEIHMKKLEKELYLLKKKVKLARKSGDPKKIEEAERALDKFLHPEKYRPAVKPVKREAPTGKKVKTSGEKEVR